MKTLATTAFLTIALHLAACSSNVSVSAPVISAMEFGSQTKTPGNFAVWIQSGAWKTTVESKGFTCSAWEFPTDFDTAYLQAAREAFQSSFEKVTFTQNTLKPEELKAQALDAQIIVYQGNIKSTFVINTGFFSSPAQADVTMDGTVAVIGHSGLVGQGTARGGGSGTKSLMTCNGVSEAIMLAGGDAIKDFVISSVDAAKLNVLEYKTRSALAEQN